MYLYPSMGGSRRFWTGAGVTGRGLLAQPCPQQAVVRNEGGTLTGQGPPPPACTLWLAGSVGNAIMIGGDVGATGGSIVIASMVAGVGLSVNTSAPGKDIERDTTFTSRMIVGVGVAIATSTGRVDYGDEDGRRP